MEMKTEMSELVRTLLARRGIEAEDVAAFLSPDYDAHTHDPFLLRDMETAVRRIFSAIENGERIAVYADFDCDGIPGAAILSDFFAKIGYGNVEVYVPHRDREGYGFHTAAIDALAERGAKLIITVDVGTVAFDACAHAKEIGVDVIVTDHHEMPSPSPEGRESTLPDAVAVLNPKREGYPFPHLCGTGVAFKLVQAALIEGKRRGLSAFKPIPDGWEKWLLDLVAIATVADMVPLTAENRVFVHWGLRVLRKSPRAGVIALCNLLRLRKDQLTEDDIGFSIAPRINAASRMDEPDLALRLLTTTDADEADRIARRLEELNASRKGVVGGIVKQARKHVSVRFADDEKIIFLGDPQWKPALLGLAANSIMNDRGGVVCLWGRDARGNLKGSCRSDGRVSLADLFAATREHFEECGGHACSGGFSVAVERVHTMGDVLARAADALTSASAAPAPVREHEASLSLREVSWTLLRDISRLAPFGVGNPKPVFLIPHARVSSIKMFGKEKNHIEIMCVDETNATTLRAFDFFRSPEQFTHTPSEGATMSILATVERDTFRSSIALRIVDVLPAR